MYFSVMITYNEMLTFASNIFDPAISLCIVSQKLLIFIVQRQGFNFEVGKKLEWYILPSSWV